MPVLNSVSSLISSTFMQNLNFIDDLQDPQHKLKNATLLLHFITAIYQCMRLTLVLPCSAFYNNFNFTAAVDHLDLTNIKKIPYVHVNHFSLCRHIVLTSPDENSLLLKRINCFNNKIIFSCAASNMCMAILK